MNYIDYIKLIINNSIKIQNYSYNNHIIYQYKDKYLFFWINENNNYIDGMQYINYNKKAFWIWTTPKEFYEKIINLDNKLQFVEYSFRKYGQPKLPKPKELKGIKQVFSIDYIYKKCKCQVFIKNNDIWIKHKDYFSSIADLGEDNDKPLEYICKKYLNKDKSNKFIYSDCWGSVVLRNEAWICIKNLLYKLKSNESELDLLINILRQQEKVCNFKENELCCSYMERFWGKIISKCKEYI